MANYKYYFGNGFAGCKLLAHTRDVYRERDVRVFMIPGEFDVVGVTDGTDCWIAPVAADPFRVNVADLIRRVRAGEPITVSEPPKRPRRALIDEAQPSPRPMRRALVEEPQAPKQRRKLLEV